MDNKLAIVKETAEAVGAVLEKVPVYPDAVQPMAKELGKTIALPLEFLNTVLRPVKSILLAANIAFDDLDARLRELLRGVPPEKIVEPPAMVAGPLLLAYPFVKDDPPLREMFEQLLASAMNADTKEGVHPSFVEILKQMTGDEAKIIQAMQSVPNRYRVCGNVQINSPADGYRRVALVTLLDEVLPSSGHRLQRYVENLGRLGLLEVSLSESLVGRDDDYKSLESHPVFKSVRESVAVHSKDRTVTLARGVLTLTLFGQSLLAACVSSKTPIDAPAEAP